MSDQSYLIGDRLIDRWFSSCLSIPPHPLPPFHMPSHPIPHKSNLETNAPRSRIGESVADVPGAAPASPAAAAVFLRRCRGGGGSRSTAYGQRGDRKAAVAGRCGCPRRVADDGRRPRRSSLSTAAMAKAAPFAAGLILVWGCVWVVCGGPACVRDRVGGSMNERVAGN